VPFAPRHAATLGLHPVRRGFATSTIARKLAKAWLVAASSFCHVLAIRPRRAPAIAAAQVPGRALAAGRRRIVQTIAVTGWVGRLARMNLQPWISI
jgi:hypothetical protein